MISKYFKYAGKGLLWILAASVAAFLIACLFYRDIPASVLEAKWATPPSKFVVLDGLRVHYRDEGQGPAVVLLHANYANLYMWEPWAAALKDKYRVIRFDLSAHGLTGPDATRDYSLERSAATLGRLLDYLKIDTATLGGTSLGGTVALHYTVAHPERVERLILISPGSLEKDVRGRKTARPVPRAADVLILVTPRALARFLLASNYGDESKVTAAGVNEWYEFWLREGNRRAMLDRLRQYVSGDVEAKIAAVKVPVLLMWGEKNPRVPVALAYEFQKLLTGSPQVDLKILPGVGHMAVQEAPEETSRIVREYLDAAQAGAATSSVSRKQLFTVMIGRGLTIGRERREQCDRRASAIVTAGRRMGVGSSERARSRVSPRAAILQARRPLSRAAVTIALDRQSLSDLSTRSDVGAIRPCDKLSAGQDSRISGAVSAGTPQPPPKTPGS